MLQINMSMHFSALLAGTHCPGVEVPDVDRVVLGAADDPFPFLVRGPKARKDAVLAVDVACTCIHRRQAAWQPHLRQSLLHTEH